MFPPENRHQLWNGTVPKQIGLPAPDWPHLKEFQQPFEMGPIWLLWIHSFKSSILPKMIIIFKWEHFYLLGSRFQPQKFSFVYFKIPHDKVTFLSTK